MIGLNITQRQKKFFYLTIRCKKRVNNNTWSSSFRSRCKELVTVQLQLNLVSFIHTKSMTCQTYRAITYMSCYCTNCLPLYKALHPVRVLMCDVFLFICSWYRTWWIISESLVGYIVCIYSLLLGHLYCMHKQTILFIFIYFFSVRKNTHKQWISPRLSKQKKISQHKK